jgi:hypothetical protein
MIQGFGFRVYGSLLMVRGITFMAMVYGARKMVYGVLLIVRSLDV